MAVKPGCSGTVAPYSSITAGPATTAPGRQIGPPVDGRGRVPVARVEAHLARGPGRSRPPGRGRPDAGSGGPADRADPGHAQVHPLDLLLRPVPEAVAVELLVRVVEGGHGGVGHGRRERAVGQRHPYLEGLAEVAQVGGTGEALLGRVEALGSQRGGRPGPQHGPGVAPTTAGSSWACRATWVCTWSTLHVHGQQPERRQVARVARHHADRHADDVDEPAQQQRARPAERGEREVAHVKSTLDGDLAQRVGLVPGRDLQDAGRGGGQVEVELGAPGRSARPGRPPGRAAAPRPAGAAGSGRAPGGRR